MTALTKYLSRYAEPETMQLAGFSEHFQQGLVIPIYRETTTALERFCNFAEHNAGTLLVLVINRPESDSEQSWCRDYLSTPKTTQWRSANGQLQLVKLGNHSGLLLVDRCLQHPAINDKQGVGLARKIGADLLCELIQRQWVSSPWIYNSDADAYLPKDYFEATRSCPTTTAAALYPFQHCFNDRALQALPTLLYEFSLHYYVAGLQWAGSPYAYHSLGSILAVHHQAYAKVRGFPKRAGAEDFYLLNKVAKTGSIISLEEPVINIEARESSRVPFGTGPAVIAVAQLPEPLAMPVYHPDCFHYLKAFLNQLEHYADHTMPSLQENPGIDPDLLASVVMDIGFEQALTHADKQGKDKHSRLQHLHHWFDGFKTLKFIHRLRDRQLDSIPFKQLQNRLAEPRYQGLNTARMQSLLRSIDQRA